MSENGGYPPQITARLDADAKEILGRYPQSRSALLPLLHLVQAEDGCVTEGGIEFCAATLGLTSAEVTAVATFYSMYRRTPTGDYLVGVCTNALCAVMGGDAILDRLCAHLGVDPGQTTGDGVVTVEHVECNAACDYAPVVMVNWEFFDNQTPASTVTLVDSLVAGTPVTASRGPVVQDFKHVSRVLAGFEDDLVDEGGAGGAATMVGLEIARKHHWHAPAYSGSETADASNAEVGDAHVGEANSSADRATSAGAPKDLEKGKDV